MDTSITHLTLKCFVSNSHLDIRTGFAATLLCRLLENKREGCQPIRPTTAHNAESSVTDNIIAPKLKHQLLEARYQAHNGERVCSSREGTLRFDKQGRRQRGYQGDCQALSPLLSNFSMLGFDC